MEAWWKLSICEIPHVYLATIQRFRYLRPCDVLVKKVETLVKKGGANIILNAKTLKRACCRKPSACQVCGQGKRVAPLPNTTSNKGLGFRVQAEG